jgi:hypothetical protein
LRTLERLGNVKLGLSVFVGCDPANEIAPANAINMVTARIKLERIEQVHPDLPRRNRRSR